MSSNNIYDEQLNPISMIGGVFNIADNNKFQFALQLIKESLYDKGATLYCADNIITWNRNLSFLRNENFTKILSDQKSTPLEKLIIWRTYILVYLARFALSTEGDFVECGCHTGYTAEKIINHLNFSEIDRKFWLYDLFEWKQGDEHTLLEGHNNPNMYDEVISRFSIFQNVEIIKGSVPNSFKIGFPEKISFCHIDMNYYLPEAGALREILPRLSKGGVIVFDDYGWWGYCKQKLALDPIAQAYGQEILELPTGQGILLKI